MGLYARFTLLIAVFFSTVLVSLAQGHARAGDRARGTFDFERVGGLAGAAAPAPAPHDTLAITAAIPYLGEYGTGEAYVHLADAHSVLTRKLVMLK